MTVSKDKQKKYEQDLEALKPLIAIALENCSKATNDTIASILGEELFGGAAERIVVIQLVITLDRTARRGEEVILALRQMQHAAEMDKDYKIEVVAREQANRDDAGLLARRVTNLTGIVDAVANRVVALEKSAGDEHDRQAE
ncbi:MAG: hypothetical protein V3U34_00640 [candidate division NC10 bacterium]